MKLGSPASLVPLVLTLCAAQARPQDPSGSRLDGVDRALDGMVEDGAAVGVVAVVERGGERLLEHAAGELARGGGEMEPDSIFRIFSMTKPVTAVGALVLLDEGAFGLDDPVGSYLPPLAELRAVDPEDDDATIPLETPLRVRDLFQHTAGWSYQTPWRRTASRNGDRDPDLAAMVRALGELPLDFQPGSRWQYGISNDVLGALIEAVAEEPLDAFLERRVFEPLGMVDTGFRVDESKLDRVAALHTGRAGRLREVEGRFSGSPTARPTLIEGGAGLYSTAGDYVRFLRMLANGGELDGERILQAETVALMSRDHVGEVPKDRTLMGRDYGLGIAITVGEDDVGTPGTLTWGGAAGTTFWLDPATDTIAVFLVQNWLDFGPASKFGEAVAEAFAAPRASEPPLSEDAEDERDPGRRDVLFYLIDTCRADRTSVHGHDRPTTPFLDELAARSVVFERCYSQAPWTKPSMAALLTSRYPSEVGIHQMVQRLSSSALTFPEVLQRAGWTTAGFSANPLMGAFSNYAQGFDHFTESVRVNRADPIHFASGSAAKLNEHVFDWLGSSGSAPTFLYVHSVDPHEEYEPAPEYLEQFADPQGMDLYREQWEALLETRPDVPGNHLTQWNFDQAGIDPGPFIEHGLNLYDADVLANDVEIERLWARLREGGWGEDTIVIVTSDHGEEFFEHGGTSHGYSLYEESIHVPLIVHAPGLLPEGVRIDRPVRSIDLYPTLLDLLDIEAPEGLRGRSLVPLAKGQAEWEDVPVFAELAEDPLGRMAGSGAGTTTAMIDGDWKLHVNYVDPVHRDRAPVELFDLGADPGETVDLAGDQAQRAAQMKRHVESWAAANMGLRLPADELDPDGLDPALRAELEALGYLADGGGTDLPDIGDALPVLARAVLEADDRWNLYALHPDPDEGERVGEKERLRRWRILGEERVRGDERDRVLDLLYRSLSLAKDDDKRAACFMPRHGIRAVYHGHTVDLILCFQCIWMQIWMDGEQVGGARLYRDVEPAMSAAYEAAGLQIEGKDY